MNFSFSEEDEAFRAEVREWLTARLDGAFASLRGRGGPGDEHALFSERLAWEHELAAGGLTCVGWPTEFGGRGLSLYQQVIWFEEYRVRAARGVSATSARPSPGRRSSRSATPTSTSGSCRGS